MIDFGFIDCENITNTIELQEKIIFEYKKNFSSEIDFNDYID
jgi:hypothetical protein